MWKRVISIAHRLGFTQNEASVIVFLSVVIVAGSVLSELQTTDAQPHRDIRSAYRQTDSAFAARARMTEDPEAPGAEASSTEAVSVVSEGRRNVAQPVSININTASEAELRSLPGIGPVTAKRIISFRETHGGFRNTEDIMKVKSIGEKKFENIRQFITVE